MSAPRLVTLVAVALSALLLVALGVLLLTRDDGADVTRPGAAASSPPAVEPSGATEPVEDGEPAPEASGPFLERAVQRCDAEEPALPEARRVVHVAPVSGGDADGSSPEDPVDLPGLADRLGSLGPGTAVQLTGDAGPYQLDDPLVLRGGGTAEQPLVVRGAPGQPLPVLRGDRPQEPGPDLPQGGEAFRLDGADHVVLADLEVRDLGTVVRLRSDGEDLTVRGLRVSNVTRVVENDKDVTVQGLTVRDTEARGFSRSFARLRGDTSEVLMCDVVGDSERQEVDPFAQGVQLDGTVHEVALVRATMDNSQHTRAEDEYWNGDGFSAEREVTDVLLQETSASGHTDAGYDLKSERTVLRDVRAADNKRNFRLWSDVEVTGCTSDAPASRGGTGRAAHVQSTSDGSPVLSGCTFGGPAGTPDDPPELLFLAEEESDLTVRDATVTVPDPDVSLVEAEASLELEGVIGPDGGDLRPSEQ